MRRQLILAAALAALATPASAQTLHPMRKDVRAFTDHFALKLWALNPSAEEKGFEMRVVTTEFQPVEAAQLHYLRDRIQPGGRIPVIVRVPFDDAAERTVLVCLSSDPVAAGPSLNLRSEVCGRYHASRLSF